MKTKILILLLLCLSIYVSSVATAYAETKKEPGKSQNMQMNLADVELATLARFVSETTGKNFIFDERLKGKVTIITPSNLSSADSFNLFTSVLELKGFTVISSGVNAYKIIPAAEAKQRGLQIDPAKTPVNESYIARLIPLKYISAEDALKFLQPLVSKDGHISTFGPGNLVFVVDSGLNIEKVLKIIEDIDKQSTREEPEIVFLKHSSADVIAKLINDGASRKSRPAAQMSAAEETKAVPDTRLNAVVLFGEKTAKESMKSLITLLDIPPFEAQGRINVYFLENADAVEIAKVLEGVIKGAQPQKTAGAAPVTPFEAVGGITITADKYTNSLIILASPSDYLNISQILKQLDKRRRQVFVEAMITEVSMEKLLELGAKWRGAVLHNGRPVFVGGIGEVSQATIGNVINGMSGLTMGGLGRYFTIPKDFIGATSDVTAPGLAAIFNLSDFKNVVNVLSTPQLLTSDNKEAEILVGDNVPFISKRESSPLTATYIPTTSVERQDVGIKLRITPQITEGDYVKLDIYQEISALITNESENILINVGPTITKRSTKTSVVVKDKQTIVIGGLMQEKDEESVTKVPLLGDIPLFGYLFKQKKVHKTKTNLLVFITPHVVKDAEPLAKLTGEKQKEFARVENQYAEGELIVKFRENVSEDTAKTVIARNGASVIKFIEDLKVYQIKLKEGESMEDGKKLFSALPEVLFAEPNFMIRIK